MFKTRRPGLAYEHVFWKRGFRCVAGLDEVGRGALAGPVVAAAVILPPGFALDGLKGVNDSKQLTPAAREEHYPRICDAAVAWAAGSASHQEIDQMGIVPATRLAMCRALEQLALKPEALLIDALRLPTWAVPQRAIIHGDARCLSIAAASVVAKVTRDRLMCELDAHYPAYHFAENKGYGTPEHLAALREFGPLDIHRRSFAPIDQLIAGLPLPDPAPREENTEPSLS